MASFRVPTIRYTIGNAAPCLRNVQRRWAQVHDVRFLVTHQSSDKVTDRYQEKLQEKARQCVMESSHRPLPADQAPREGLRDVEELKVVYREKIKSQRQRTVISSPTPQQSPSSTSSSSVRTPRSPYPPPPPPPPQYTPSPAQSSSQSTTPPGIRTLSSYIDISKTLQLPQREIEYIWRLCHASDPKSLCAVIPQDTYSRIESTARRHPQFILPLPREEKGAEIHFLQWTFPTPTTATVLFTHLAEFKLRGEYAQPHTTVTHHLDLRDEKGLVLLQGSVFEGRGVSVEEGKWLLMCLQKFYGGEGEKVERRRLLESFSEGAQAFKVEELLEEADRLV
ncbi:MAG: hypothetical protein Q9217_005524 [Psora testacea]